jgi:proton-dependent oligopeptide transporter, POT family
MAQPQSENNPYSSPGTVSGPSGDEGALHLKWVKSPLVFGHPAGLFTLFFAEMWERFSFYGMRALLVMYMGKVTFLKYDDSSANAVYGAYCALVYMTPFLGGLLADRLLGQRRAVILGAILMAIGHQLMAVQHQVAFYMALAFLIAGNGFFKPNISTIVGTLYAPGSPKRDGGFTIFYMGVNLGAAIAPLLCGYVGEHYNWHWGFGLATIGMLIGLAVFVAPTIVTQVLILCGALSIAAGLWFFHPSNLFSLGCNVFTAVSILAAAGVALVALQRGGVPAEAGLPPNMERLSKPRLGPLTATWLVYLGTLLAVVVFCFLVSGFAFFTPDHKPITLIPDSWVNYLRDSPHIVLHVAAVLVRESSRPATLVLSLAGLLAFGYLIFEMFYLPRVQRQRMYVVLVLTFFSVLFFAFFEQAGSSLTNFTDRNVDRVTGRRTVTAAEVGTTIEIQPTQKQLGYHNGDQLFTLNILTDRRDEQKKRAEEASNRGVTTLDPQDGPDFTIPWKVAKDNVGMEIAEINDEIPSSTFQSVNAIFILIFGLPFTALWGFLGRRGWEPSTTVKFSLGILQVGLGFAAFWYGARTADARGMVGLSWLILGYLLHTTGELCLSPVGLSMVSKLSPARLVSTVMGAWFLATAFAQMVASVISQFANVTEGSGKELTVPAPHETVHVYGDVFGQIAIMAIVAAVICFALAPILNRWMHPEVDTEGAETVARH